MTDYIPDPDEEVCTYCGTERGDRLSCCGENHFVTYAEFEGQWPDEKEPAK